MMGLLLDRITGARKWFVYVAIVGFIAGLMTLPGTQVDAEADASPWQTGQIDAVELPGLAEVLVAWLGTTEIVDNDTAESQDARTLIDYLTLVGIVDVDGRQIAHLLDSRVGLVSVSAGEELDNGVLVSEIMSDGVRLEYESGAKMLELTLYPKFSEPGL